MEKLFIIITLVIVVVTTGTVTVFAQTLTRNPIIIIPGIGASWNTKIMVNTTPTATTTGWGFAPSVNQYNPLIQSLKDAGLVQGKDFFIAFYDWRQGNASSATNYLIPTIDKVLANSPTGKVDIVAHSMGGLVARAYIQSDAYRGDVDKLIMLGTPNEGSSDVYTLWEGGSIPKNWDKSVRNDIKVLLDYYNISTGFRKDYYDIIHQVVPSIQELLPTYDFLVDKGSGNSIPVANMQDKNSFLSILNSSSNIQKLVMRVTGGVSIIAGENENTIGNIPIIPHTSKNGKLWVDGAPNPSSPLPNTTLGDSEVLLKSAFIGNGFIGGLPPVLASSINIKKKDNIFVWLLRAIIPTADAQGIAPQTTAPSGDFIAPPPLLSGINEQVIPARHGDLPTASISKIFSILGIQASTKVYVTPTPPKAILTFWFASPVAVRITSPSGKVTTKAISNIPGATYEGSSNPLGFKMVVIENPEAGKYKVNLTGLAVGGYHMGVTNVSSTGDTGTVVKGNVVKDQQVGYAVQYDPTNAQTPTTISEPIEVAPTPKQLFEKFRTELKTTTAKRFLKRILLRKINQAESAYNKGKVRKSRRILSRIDWILKRVSGRRWFNLKKDQAKVLQGIIKEIKDSIQKDKKIKSDKENNSIHQKKYRKYNKTHKKYRKSEENKEDHYDRNKRHEE